MGLLLHDHGHAHGGIGGSSQHNHSHFGDNSHQHANNRSHQHANDQSHQHGNDHSHQHANDHGHQHASDSIFINSINSVESLLHSHSPDIPTDVDAVHIRLTGKETSDVEVKTTADTRNINVRAAFIHVVGDLFQSFGVLTAAYVIYYKVGN